MAWRWFQRIRLPFGINANLSKGGVGWSWGLGFIRWGVSPYGRKWVSLGLPGTGFRIFKYIDEFPLIGKKKQQTIQNAPTQKYNTNQHSQRKKYPPLRKK